MYRNINKYEINNDTAILTIIDTKGRNTKVLVDADMVDELKQYSFRLNGNGYIKTGSKNKYLHRIILNYDGSLDIDHINRNKLDNRKCNLRIITHKENQNNRYRDDNYGIVYIKGLNKPYRLNLKGKYYGYYSTLEEAKEKRNIILGN